MRIGDVNAFNAVVKQYAATFQADRTFTLVLRFVVPNAMHNSQPCSLRHNVIKTGLRLICLSYQRISLADIAQKLNMDSAEDAQYIVAKVGRCDGHVPPTTAGHPRRRHRC